MPRKDVRLGLETGRTLGVPLPSTAAVQEVLTTADKLGYGQRDIAALYEVLMQMATPPVDGTSQPPRA